MYPTWPMVFAALVAGVLAGFMVPDRPQSRPAPAATETSSAPAKTAPAAAKTAKRESDDIRSVPLTKTSNPDPAPAPRQDTAAGSCASKTWPYRVADCLDRTASVAPASTVVSARRVDPSVTLAAQTEPGKSVPSNSEPAAPKQKTAAAPLPSQQPEPAVAPAADTARAEAIRPAAATAEPPAREAPRRPQRRLNTDLDFNDGIPTRIYLRGPDGRLYLAPEYRPEGRYRYYVR